MPYLTSCAVIGRPVSKRTPSRRVNVQLSPSSDGVPRSVARSGTSSSVRAGLGGVGDQGAGVEPHQVPHAGQVGALRVQAVDLRRDDPEGAAGRVGGGADAVDAGVGPSADDRHVGAAAGTAAGS